MGETQQGIPTLAQFIERLEEALAPHPHSVSVAFRILAAEVPSERRMEVLSRLPKPSVTTDPELALRCYPEIPLSSPDSELVQATDAFVRRLEDGEYYRGLSWDDEQNEERAWGDDSWAKEMDEFFGRAAAAYLQGRQTLSARIYGRLLHSFRYQDRGGVFCGSESPDRMVQSNLSEAKRRYFRALFEVSPLAERPTRLLVEMESLRTVGDLEIGLRAMIDTEPDGSPPLDEIDSFLPSWIAALEERQHDDSGWGREARRLLREAVELEGGVDGLGRLARDAGADHPEAYHEWVGLLVRLDRIPEAIRAAEEGVDRIRDAMYRARLADRLVFLATSQDDHSLAVEAARSAWRASPTKVRLLCMVRAAEQAGMRDPVLVREASAVLRSEWLHSDALACRLLLLVGRHEEALTRFQRANALGWGRADHAGSVVMPFLLLASTGLKKPPSGSVLETLWEDLDAPGRQYFDRRLLLDAMTAGVAAAADVSENERPYSVLLTEAVVDHPIPRAHRSRILGTAQQKVEAVIGDILDGQHRRGHQLAAQLTVAVAEALSLARTSREGQGFVVRIRAEYARYSVFQDALSDARQASSVLSDASDPDRPPLVLVK